MNNQLLKAKEKFMNRTLKNIDAINSLKLGTVIICAFYLSMAFMISLSFTFLESVLGKDLNIILIIMLSYSLYAYFMVSVVPFYRIIKHKSVCDMTPDERFSVLLSKIN